MKTKIHISYYTTISQVTREGEQGDAFQAKVTTSVKVFFGRSIMNLRDSKKVGECGMVRRGGVS